MYKAKLYSRLLENLVKCTACQRYCKISNNNLGFCQTRLNKDGTLFSLTYGVLNGIQADPIEKKPLYHFKPGSVVLSIGSYGCNYRCKQCLNWHCSWGNPANEILADLKFQTNNGLLASNYASPEDLINLVISKNYKGIAFTYNEPSIWPEYVYDTAKLAKQKGLYTVFVTNGSWTLKALDYYGKYLDAVNIDIKGFYSKTYEKMGAFFGSILKTTEAVVKKYKILTELTTLLIPTINDSAKELEDLTNWIYEKLGPEIPWHLSRFDPKLSPSKDFQSLKTTSIESLKKAYNIGKKAGLKHIYVWAPPKNFTDRLFSIGDTYCPKCGKLLLKRTAWEPEITGLKKIKNKAVCKFCDKELYFKI